VKTAVVPAQITTVEDKIAGNVSLSQLILLALPLFIGTVLYIVFPPTLSMTLPKLTLGGLVAIVCCSLAVRVKGKIVLLWAVTIVRYNLRPRYYVFSKNSSYLRGSGSAVVALDEGLDMLAGEVALSDEGVESLAISDLVRIESALADPKSNLAFKATRKGGLRVHITQVK